MIIRRVGHEKQRGLLVLEWRLSRYGISRNLDNDDQS